MWLWCRLAAASLILIRSQAWEPPYTVGVDLKDKTNKETDFFFFFFFFFSFFLFFFFFGLFAFSRAAPGAYGDSQARGLNGAVATGLLQRSSNVGSKPHLQPTPQLMAPLDP